MARRALPPFAALAVLIAGCDLVTYRPPVGRDFGHPYALREGIRVAVSPTLILETPAVDPSRRLFAVVEYEGGCREHTFSMGFDAEDEARTYLWLIHDDGGDRCEGLIRDTVAVDLGAAYRAGSLILEIPNGDPVSLMNHVPGGG